MRPDTLANWPSMESECNSGVRTPPPNGARTVMAGSKRPWER